MWMWSDTASEMKNGRGDIVKTHIIELLILWTLPTNMRMMCVFIKKSVAAISILLLKNVFFPYTYST